MKKTFKLFAFLWAVCSLFLLCSCNNENHSHSLSYHNSKEPTCTEEGNIAYWECSECGDFFADEMATGKIENVKLPLKHTLVHNENVAAGCAENGIMEHWFCSTCAKTFSDEAATSEIKDTVVLGSHDLVLYEGKTPTCTENGVSEHWVCTKCHNKFSDPKTLTVANNIYLPGEHSFVDGICEKCSSVGSPELIYELLDEQYMVSGITNSSVLRIVIPPSYNGIPVTGISDKAFQNCSELMSVEISENISTIGDAVFDGCDKLVEIVNNSDISIPQTESAADIHSGTTKLKNVYGFLFYIVGDTDAVLVGYVGGESKPVLPENFIIEDSVRTLVPLMVVGEDFENTFIKPLLERFEALLETDLRSSMPEQSFSFFDNGEYVQYENGYINLSTRNGAKKYIQDMKSLHLSIYKRTSDEAKAIIDLSNDIVRMLSSYSIKNPSEYLGNDKYLEVLEEMYEEYPITREGVAVYVYSGSDAIEAKENIANIVKRYFSDYNHQTMYDQESACGYVHNTYSVGKNAFSERSDIVEITVSTGVNGIASDAFEGCKNLVIITVSAGNKYYSSLDGNLYNASGNVLIRYAPGKTEESFDLPIGVDAIEKNAFRDHNLKSIVIADGVTEIKAEAFSELYSLEDKKINIVLPGTLEIISKYAFYRTPLEIISLPEGVKTVGSYAFEGTGIEEIYIPASVELIGVCSFGSAVKSFIVNENNKAYHVSGNSLINTEQKILVSGTVNSQIPSDGSVEIIGYGAFAALSGVETIHIPASVLYIMNGAFAGNADFSGLTYDGDTLFFVYSNGKIENDAYVVEYFRDYDYDKENRQHNERLVAYIMLSDLFRSEERIEYYIEIYNNYIQAASPFI